MNQNQIEKKRKNVALLEQPKSKKNCRKVLLKEKLSVQKKRDWTYEEIDG